MVAIEHDHIGQVNMPERREAGLTYQRELASFARELFELSLRRGVDGSDTGVRLLGPRRGAAFAAVFSAGRDKSAERRAPVRLRLRVRTRWPDRSRRATSRAASGVGAGDVGGPAPARRSAERAALPAHLDRRPVSV